MFQRNITGLAGCQCQRHAHNIGLHGIQRIGFGVDADKALIESLGDPLIEGGHDGHGFICGVIDGDGAEGCFDIFNIVVIPADAGIQAFNILTL